MSRIIMLIPTSSDVGLSSVSLGVIRAIERNSVRLGVFKPVTQSRVSHNKLDRTTATVRGNSHIALAESLPMAEVERLIGASQQDVLMEEIVSRCQNVSANADVVLVEGLIPTEQYPFANSLNYDIAQTLGAEIVFVTAANGDCAEQIIARIELACASFGGIKNSNIAGVIINKLNAPIDAANLCGIHSSEANSQSKITRSSIDAAKLTAQSPIPVLGCVSWNSALMSPRAIDFANHLQAQIINEGEINTRRITSVAFCTENVPNVLTQLNSGSLLVVSADRAEIIVSACLAAMNGTAIGAILLTGGYDIDAQVKKLCERAFATGLPLFVTQATAWQTSLQLHNVVLQVAGDDHQRIEQSMNFVADHIAPKWIDTLSLKSTHAKRLSPPAFRYQLTELARKANKKVVLPEGDEPRTIKAAAICAERGIAECLLLGNPADIERIAISQGVTLGKGIEIIDPTQVREKYVPRLVELRKSKGMTEDQARAQLEDTVVLGTMMLEANEVDGLVSGAVHTTANTIRPPLQLIKTAPGSSLVSSVFFMLMPDQVYIYGDCAINPNPTAEQLAEIAIQSADTAIAFGIDAKVAMISYSTGDSGQGADVDKVRAATRLAQEKRPDLLIDGPLQYDAAVMADVAKSKAPDSKVAGQATVFIFPDLNTGNTTYKAVQRSANLVSIGPMLQGMRKPVNDLSRGALVDDIVYTIALTAIQATQSA